MNPRRAQRLRRERLDDKTASAAAERARALGDPTRLTLLAAMRDGDEMCVCDLAWVAGKSQNLISHHLQTLRVAGLVTGRKQGKMVMHRLTGEGEALLDAALVHQTKDGGGP